MWLLRCGGTFPPTARSGYSLGLGLFGDVPNGGAFFSYDGSNELGGNQQAERQVAGLLLGPRSRRALSRGASLPKPAAASGLLGRALLGGHLVRDVGHFQREVLQLEPIQFV